MFALLVSAAITAQASDSQIIANTDRFMARLAKADAQVARSSGTATIKRSGISNDPAVFVLYDCSEFLVTQTDGHIDTYWFASPLHVGVPWPEDYLANDRVLSLAESYAELGGIPGPIRVIGLSREELNQDGVFQVDFVGTAGGVPLVSSPSSYLRIDPANGRLLFASYRKPPLPPDDLTPLIGPQQAQDVYLGYLFAEGRHHRNSFTSVKYPYRLTETAPPLLCVYKPAPKEEQDEDSFYTSAQVQEAQEGKGQLVWLLKYDVPPMVDGAPVMRKFDGFVDARTGRLLRFNEYWPMGSAKMILKNRKRHDPLLWDLPEGPVRILSGKRSRLVRQASVRFIRQQKAKQQSYPLVLEFGRMIVPCRYDARANLLATGLLGKEALGRQSESLHGELAKLTSKKR
jgi:hypothetical protein